MSKIELEYVNDPETFNEENKTNYCNVIRYRIRKKCKKALEEFIKIKKADNIYERMIRMGVLRSKNGKPLPPNMLNNDPFNEKTPHPEDMFCEYLLEGLDEELKKLNEEKFKEYKKDMKLLEDVEREHNRLMNLQG